LFNISGTQIRVNNSSIAVGSYPVTVRADDGFGTIIFQNLVLVATAALTPMLRFNLPTNSQYIGTMTGSV
jgi:hypothetical protein